ncbi:TIGR03571 family LLM class oxidoreductase [Altericroceibacterium spongiae]|uniref:TIGR03571 family LLM class oxidoreductase n=1 Tax=Altericroceibacterium spongiae TaxID=2320269 RepID=A0A420EM69_9SPHN|nr:TIGR03571 family LLM class oxidoreductase [Altericroceibacterium spongiae]RKF21781.1 TIGR03571 family LLM class oxidoreductase [Altericroceibacterium spongiae]
MPSAMTSPARIGDAPGLHSGYGRLFAPDEMTLGLIMPLETYPSAGIPTMEAHLDAARHADEIGISGLWLRDIPFYDPQYGDAGQVFEPLTYISALAGATTRIALGTAGIVLPFREPNLLARQVATLDQISGGRMIVGFSSGDRPKEYPLFDIDFDSRAGRFREAYDLYRTFTEERAPAYDTVRFGSSPGGYDVLPKPPHGRTPAIAIGRAGQDIAWIGSKMDGVIVPSPAEPDLPQAVADWRTVSGDGFKPYGVAGFLHLEADRDYPFERVRAGFRTGSRSLAEFMERARDAGVNHIALNPRFTNRPIGDVLADLERDVLPRFPSLA